MVSLQLGAAVIGITPEPGLLLAGFAARNAASTGIHDPLSARAVVVNDTAIVVADVIGLHEDMARRIRERCALPASNVIVCATHTHGAPVSMPDRLGFGADPQFLEKLEDSCVLAIDTALANAGAGSLTYGLGNDPDVARNRRHADGLLDRAVPVLRLRDSSGTLVAFIVSYACHPTVLGADNLLVTADFPHYVRQRIEAENPGAIAIYLNACTGDANIGHTAQASWSTAANANRTFENARRLGDLIAVAAMAAPETPAGNAVHAADLEVELRLERREGDLALVSSAWQAELAGADATRKILLEHWIAWAGRFEGVAPGSWSGRVAFLDWGGFPIVALPGEIFAETALKVRSSGMGETGFVLSYAEGTPGYIPPRSEYSSGGYEVDEAHRFIGMPGSFVAGSAERLADGVISLIAQRP
ncbi:neutral/alkaline non-lysosomal ceramidase N-terminal domain-containing protein [Devosia neptuniae]|jgi:neutral ceramidase|uniref:neutral/alkaline non-lysosomal ceramidase N-terminal domain-containing protein n=1 Tax=Devosia TaxID=46913 RepID=UPI0022B020EB|nr:neutral/alkaline non-lysosomal ceramidase N-terminal domain-containing protein [Devosia neptuniae]MCZ4348124.1 neutral/alkaline non-lysosomal ceramidase N-terminal domain-containing protein [Devosia neptuniae]|tara:strand:- start:6091 stop:7344 length:1254 start_codon:yes stop_codon:yes gene_type:complete